MRITTTLPFFLAISFACGSTPLGDDPADPCALDPASRACLDRRIVDAGPTLDAGPRVDAGPVDAGPPPPPPHDAGPRSCRSAADCARDEFCEQSIGICNPTASPTGTCKPRPVSCPAIYDPVCGCDGRDYDNPCAAHFSTGIAERGKCGQRLCQNDTNCFTGTYCVIGRPNDSSCEDCSNLTRRWQCEQHSANCSWQGGRCTTHINPPPPIDAGVCERGLLDTCTVWTDCVGNACATHDNCGTGLYCESEPHSGIRFCTQICQNDGECGSGNVCRQNRCTRGCNPWLMIEQCEPRCGSGINGFFCSSEIGDAGTTGACRLAIM